MRKFIFVMLLATLGLCVDSVFAATNTYVELSTMTSRTITVSSGSTATRVDNFAGEGEGLLNLRNEVLLQNQDSADSIFCDYEVGVSTDSANSSDAGYQIPGGSPGGTRNLSIGPNISYFCVAVDAAGAAGVRLRVEQASWRLPV